MGAIVIGIVVNFWIIIPLIPLSVFFVYVRRYFVTASREIKRIENLSNKPKLSLLFILNNQHSQGRSPIFVHTSNSILGLTTIRASKSQNILIKEFDNHSNNNTEAYFAFITSNRWFAIRLDIIVAIYSIIVIYSCIIAKSKCKLKLILKINHNVLFSDYMSLTPGQVGLVLVYMFQIMALFQWTVRQSAEVENLVILFKINNFNKSNVE